MQVEQIKWSPKDKWQSISDKNLSDTANLVFAIGNFDLIQDPTRYDELRTKYPNADIITCGSDGEILNGKLVDQQIIVSALFFEKTDIQCVQIDINQVKDSFDAGTHLSADLDKDFITHLLVFSDSKNLQSSDLMTGIHINLAKHVPVTGGLPGIYQDTNTSLVGLNGPPKKGQLIGIGFSGENLQVGYSIARGWTSFGAEKTITRVENNRLYEIDHKSAYHFYQQYLEHVVDDVDQAISQFPLGIKRVASDPRIVRSAIELHPDGSITFSSGFSIGDNIRMMKTNISSLLSSVQEAANHSLKPLDDQKADFLLLVNCSGRRNVLKDWVCEEIESVNSILSYETPMMGFYSHGEISPNQPNSKSEVHNQCLVFTAFREN
ncbi:MULTISPECIES: FIST signal transduction protein [Reichenbachiella]|uniref:FIST signal transduction protein n=1 Tax=Reichenbachiella TaxID=156993 RepID=UPI000E6B6CC7|nr:MULTISPECIES: FIST N-terminal domain-containing protein [Reichenbachiella]MBU2912489.1 FIST C-terminal domain-containing protein [Reichenbachiella agariperforans]RJE72646.1 hypothetical protein BGP76_01395 [Reichenbachiella sp. MSK19-1]